MFTGSLAFYILEVFMELMKKTVVYADCIGLFLKERRLALNMSQKDLSKETGVSQTEISHIENGKPPLFSLNVLILLCDGLGIDIHDAINYSRKIQCL